MAARRVSCRVCQSVLFLIAQLLVLLLFALDTGVRRLMRGLVTLPQGNQEPLMVKDKVGNRR